MEPKRIITFFSTIIVSYLLVDCLKILLAKQLRNKLTTLRIYRIKSVISVILVVFGIGLVLQGFFPAEKEKLKNTLENIRVKEKSTY